MRIATLILGLILGFLLFLQTMLGGALSSLAEDEGGSESSAVGIFSSIIWLVASALVMAFPLFSTILFALASALLFAASGDFPDLAIWGGVSIALALMSFFGWRGKKRDQKEAAAEKQRQLERDQRIEELVRQQQRAQ